ncbi:probable aldo-keto reductase 1 isoform X2 [Populus alba]|uniref:probable aldo-keto reductase 1 isoform X2 n=1 Tax=Populus alba TaxID=43335 RepID=UPI003CC7935F
MAEEQKVIIPRVKLGNQGLEVSKLGFGCMGLSGIYNAPLPEEALKHLPREKIQLATKFGVFPNRTEIKNPAINGSPEYIRACCDTSLKRLDLECIDLYYQHRVDTSVPIEETVC